MVVQARMPCLIALAAIASVGAALLAASSAGASSQLGQRGARLAPTCPENCQAVARVTGFQTSIDGEPATPRAPQDGRIVSWTVRLGAPDRDQVSFFENQIGAPASARITTLRPAGAAAFRAVAQSPVKPLGSFFGQAARFDLIPAIRVRRGDIVALTSEGWVPSLAAGPEFTEGTAWRASRQPPCDDTASQAAHRLGVTRRYGCAYTTAALAYSAEFRPGASEPVFFSEVFGDYWFERLRQRPRAIHGGSDFGWLSISWRRWGGASAYGTGRAYYVNKDRVPYRRELWPASFRLGARGTCFGRSVYRSMLVANGPGRDPRIPRRWRFDYPCSNASQ